jgi:chaperonin GroES
MKKTKAGVSRRSEENTSGVYPLGDRVLIKEIDEKETMTSTGIYIPETVENDKGSKKGMVVAVGEGRFEEGKRVPVQVSVGDTVLFQWGDKLKVKKDEYFIVRENEILAVIK